MIIIRYYFDPFRFYGYPEPPMPIEPLDSHDRPPMGPPPPYTPYKEPDLYRVDPGTIRGCKNKYTYIWLNNGEGFWFYPTKVTKKSVSGYRWIGFWWMYYGTDLRRIDSFMCY